MPHPIRTNKSQYEADGLQKESNELFNVIPFLLNNTDLLGIVLNNNNGDKDSLRNIWKKSKTGKGGLFSIGSGDVNERELAQLRGRGIIKKYDGGPNDEVLIELSERGFKLLREAILGDEKSNLTKEASRKLIAKNSYDFGTEVLVKMKAGNGVRYRTVAAKIFEDKNMEPIKIKNYNIQTRKADGKGKTLSEFTDEELIKVLHLAKTVMGNHKQYVEAMSKEQPLKSLPINRLKTFTAAIMQELNSR